MTKLTDKALFWISLLCLLLLPFLLLSFYCHPSADDYIVSAFVKERGIFGHLHQIYFEWSGRYFSSFLKCFNPLVYGWLWGYKLIPFVLILLFYISIYSFIRSIFSVSFNSLKKHILSLVIVLLFLNSIPSTSECIYWMDGSLNYFLGNILLLFFFAILIKSIYDEKEETGRMIAFIILPVIIVGTNEISMLALDEILVLILFRFWFIRKKIPKGLILAIAGALISTIIEMSAPGNYDKMKYFPDNMNVVFSLQQSLFSFIKISARFIIDPAFIMVSVLHVAFLPSFYENRIFKSLVNISPFYVLPLSILILLSMYFFVIFSTGLNPALRVHDAVGLFFVLFFFYNISVIHYYLVSHYKIAFIEAPAYLIKILAAASFIFIITQFSKEPGKEIICEGNIFHAYYDLFINAPEYNSELTQRENQISLAAMQHEKFIEVQPLSKIPKTIHFADITNDPKFWVNQCEAKYFGLDSIKVSEMPVDTVH
jgi:hypothetical protein